MLKINTTDDILNQPEVKWMIDRAGMQVDWDNDGNKYNIKNSSFFNGALPKRMTDNVCEIIRAAHEAGIASARGDVLQVSWDNGADNASEYTHYHIAVYTCKGSK